MTWESRLVDWFVANKREMPWRSNPKPYYVWVSEMMLQQTQVDTVIPYFNRFIVRFPTVHDLAKAPQDDVLKLWEGLGYYSRARNLHKAARRVVDEFKGSLPDSYADLQTLPGLGPYAAAAITSIAFSNAVPVVDGNVLRVFTRYWGIFENVMKQTTRSMLFHRLTPAVESVNPSDFNQGIMELGALVCTPKKPKCDICPLKIECVALHTDQIANLPVKEKAKPVPHYDISVGVVWDGDKVLIGKRKEDQMLGGLWEFPGGKHEEGEEFSDTCKRELKEETGLDVEIDKQYCIVKHAYSHFKITLHAFKCQVLGGQMEAKSASELKWITLDDIDIYAFPKANKIVLEHLKKDSELLF
jgi:A/G-specific adenine glycosylase